MLCLKSTKSDKLIVTIGSKFKFGFESYYKTVGIASKLDKSDQYL